MKIAFVHDWLNGMRGGEKVLESLIGLWPQAEIFTLFHQPERVSETINRQRIHVSPLQRIPGAQRRYRHMLPLFPWGVSRFRLEQFDLVLSISHCAAKAARAASPSRHLCYCLTPMRYLWSHYQDYFGPGQAGLLTRAAMSVCHGPLRRWDYGTRNRPGRYLAISQEIARRIDRAYGLPAKVIFPPVETDFYTPGAEPAEDYYLAVSALVPYKRIDLAIEACNRLKLPLKVVGTGPLEADLRRLAGPTIEFLGWVGAERLRDLYRRCRALIFPAEEDFGIVPVEAQACGRPVLAPGRGGTRETVIEGVSGAYFEQQTPESLQQSLSSFQAESYQPSEIRDHALRFRRENFETAIRAEVESFLEAKSNPVE